jgi:predicted HTH domain antitoxin
LTTSVVKTIRLPKNLASAIKRWARLEKVDESTAIRQLLAMGVEKFAVKLYKEGKFSLNQAAELADVPVREMLDVLASHGVRGNITLDQQKKAINFAMRQSA